MVQRDAQIGWGQAALPYVALALVVVAVWGHSVRFGFVWDDTNFIEELQSIRSLKNVPAMFTRLDAQSNAPEDFKLFRPLRTAHYAVLYTLGGGGTPKPWLFHAANLAWHIAAALLLFAVTCRLLGRFREGAEPAHHERFWAWWVAAAFAVHPVVSEVVCWAKSLDDSMAAVFTLLALRAVLKFDGRASTFAAGLAWFALAVYSKISALPFVAAAFLVLVVVLGLPTLRALRLTTGYATVAVVFMVHRQLVIGQASQTDPISGSYDQTLLDMLPVAPKYLRLLFGLPPFVIDYSYLKGNHALWSGAVLLGLVTLLATAACAALLWRRRSTALGSFGLVWLGLFLLPVSNVLPMMQYMAERFLYLPMIGFLWCLAAVAARLDAARAVRPLALAVLVLWSGVAWNRSWIWQDEVTLFVESHQAGPYTPRVAENARRAIFKLPHVREMFSCGQGQEVLRFTPVSPEKAAAIEGTLLEASALFPGDEHISTALGILYASSGREEKAVPYLRTATRCSPNNPRYWANLGHACVASGALAEGEAALEKALELAPENLEALRSLSRAYWLGERYSDSVEVLRKLQRLEPANSEYAQWIRRAEALQSR